jgi:hypothetical protein
VTAKESFESQSVKTRLRRALGTVIFGVCNSVIVLQLLILNELRV